MFLSIGKIIYWLQDGIEHMKMISVHMFLSIDKVMYFMCFYAVTLLQCKSLVGMITFLIKPTRAATLTILMDKEEGPDCVNNNGPRWLYNGEQPHQTKTTLPTTKPLATRARQQHDNHNKDKRQMKAQRKFVHQVPKGTSFKNHERLNEEHEQQFLQTVVQSLIVASLNFLSFPMMCKSFNNDNLSYDLCQHVANI